MIDLAAWGTSIPCASGTYPDDDSTSHRGMIPSRMAACSPTYTSSRKRLRARTRWASPASSPDHSSAGMMRGMRSRGQVRSIPSSDPETAKVMPCLRKIDSVSRTLEATSSALRSSSRSTRGR